MLRFPPVAIAACIVAGIGLWVTRASMDVAAAEGGELRVAMFPSGVELAALIVLSVVLALLGAKALSAVLRGRAPRAGIALPVDPLLPLLSLLWLAVPYLPWLPDAIPALRVLSGPARFIVWAVVLGQVVWVGWDVLSRSSRDSPRPQARPRLAGDTALLLAAGAAAFAGASFALAGGTVSPAGDEPHYLVVTESLLRDGDLRVANNYASGAYAEYYAATLTPDVAVRQGVDYPSLPIGLPLLIAPAFGLGGYRAVTMLLAVVAALVAALAWRWAARHSGSRESATTAWLAVAGSAPFLLHSFSVTPGIAAAGVVLAAVAWTPAAIAGRGAALAVQSLLVGSLPWLGLQYLPLATGLAVIVSGRQRTSRGAALAGLPFVVLAAGAVAYASRVWGSLLPAAAFAPSSLAIGIPAVWFDQEYGLLPYAPALMLAAPGLVSMWREGAATRRRAVEIGVAVLVLLVTVTAAAQWGGTVRPAEPMVAVLPLLLLPIAYWDRAAVRHPVRRAAGRVLVLAGLAVSAVLVVVNAGALAANRRDGSSQLLEWLAPSNDLVRLVPSFIAQAEAPLTLLALTCLWIAAAAAAGNVSRRFGAFRPGAAAPAAVALALAAGMLVATLAPAALDGRLARRVDPAARAESSMLSRFDARRRPAAVAYDEWRALPPSAVPALFTFEGRPGLRRGPQPVRVLLNTRLALPAGDYEVEIHAGPSSALDGAVGLQVGRSGHPLESWHARAMPGETWRRRFRLDVDSPFVGFRVSPGTERTVSAVLVRPLSVVNTTERLDRHLGLPPVLSAARYHGVSAYFHGSGVYPERDGFWVRGATTLLTTFARGPSAGASAVRLRVHTGDAPNRVHLDWGGWRRSADLRPGEDAVIEVPLIQDTHQAAVRIVTESGFVPAETKGGADRRRLGCWVEVLE